MRKGRIFIVAFLLFIALFILSVNASAADTTIKEGNFYYKVVDGEAIIRRVSSKGIKHLVIPETLGGYPVTALHMEPSAGEIEDKVTAITLPKTIKRLENINKEIGFKEIYVDSLETWLNIKLWGNSFIQFVDATLYVDGKALTDIVVPDSVTEIDNHVFGLEQIKSVTFSENIQSVSTNAFSGNIRVEIYVPDLETWFRICNISTYISTEVYINNEKPVDIVLPENIDTIPNYAFYSINPKSITFTSPIKEFGYYWISPHHTVDAFYVDSLEIWMNSEHKNTPLQYANCLYVGGEAVSGDYVFPETCTRIANNAFANYKALKNITLHSGIEYIGNYAFSGTGIENVYVDSLETWLTICDNIYTTNGQTAALANPMNYAENLYVAGELLVDLVIPESVTRIPAYGLFNIKTIESVTLHSGIEHIGDYAFLRTSIENVYVDSLETWLKICDNIYTSNEIVTQVANPMHYAKNLYVAGELLVDLVIPENITEIPKYAFYNVKTMKSLTLHSNVQKIGKGTFSGCTNVKSVHIPDIDAWFRLSSLKSSFSIENLYIAGELLSDYTFPEGITAIPDSAFENCVGINSITLPSSLVSIGKKAFSNCDNLESITFPASLQSIGKDAFKGCANIESVYAPSLESWLSIGFDTPYSNPVNEETSLYLNGELLENLRVPESINQINQYAFLKYSKLKTFEITGSPLTIFSGTFNTDCNNLEIHAESVEDWLSVKIKYSPDYTNCGSLMKYGATLYIGGKQPEEIVIPESVKTIPAYAFQHCYSLKKITIPATTAIGSSAFDDSGLKEVIIGSLTEKIEPVNRASASAFDECNMLNKITLGYGVKSIGSEAFYGLSTLQEVVLYSGIESIGNRAFYKTGITSVTIPSTVKQIGENAFAYCKFLSEITIGDEVGSKAVTDIEKYAFSNCTGLVKVTINSGVKKMGEKVFSKSTGIKDLYINDLVSYLGMELPYEFNAEYSNPAFYADNIYVNGKILKNLVIPEGVTRICSYAFYGFKSIETVKLPSTLKEIGYSAFSNCSNIKDLSLPDAVEMIGGFAFFSCRSITKVELKENVEEVGMDAFGYCTSLKTVYMYPKLLNMAKCAFWDCENIELILYTGTEEAWNKFLSQNKQTGLEGVAVYFRFRPESMYAPEHIEAVSAVDSITLTWSKINGVTGYRVYVEKNGKWKTVKTLNKNTYKVTGLNNGTNYKFAVKAYISSGTFVLWAPEYITINTATKPLKPSKVTAVQTTNSIELSWSKVTGADGYRIYQYNSKTKKYEAIKTLSSTSYRVEKLKAGTTYKFKIRAYKKVGDNKMWGEMTSVVTVATKPLKPSKISAVQSTNSIELSWSRVTGADGYRVYKYNSKTKKYEKVKTLNSTSYKIEKLKAGTTYKLKIRAYKKVGDNKVWGGATSAVTVATKPETPKITKLTASKGKVNLTWSNVAGESGYQVYYSTKKDSGYKKVASYKTNIVKGSKSKLTSGKTYYFKVRAYKKTASGTVYSAWSPIKSLKVK